MFRRYEINNQELIIYLDSSIITGLKDRLIKFLMRYKFDNIKKIILKRNTYEFAKIVILDYNIELAHAICLNRYGLSIDLDDKEDK